jgi:hypothetical protein
MEAELLTPCGCVAFRSSARGYSPAGARGGSWPPLAEIDRGKPGMPTTGGAENDTRESERARERKMARWRDGEMASWRDREMSGGNLGRKQWAGVGCRICGLWSLCGLLAPQLQ